MCFNVWVMRLVGCIILGSNWVRIVVFRCVIELS